MVPVQGSDYPDYMSCIHFLLLTFFSGGEGSGNNLGREDSLGEVDYECPVGEEDRPAEW